MKNEPDKEFELEREKLELDKTRLELEMKRDRTAKLLLILPLSVSVVAIISGPVLQQWTSHATVQYQSRIELFKKLTEHETDPVIIERTFDELFKGINTKTLEARRLGTPKPTPN